MTSNDDHEPGRTPQDRDGAPTRRSRKDATATPAGSTKKDHPILGLIVIVAIPFLLISGCRAIFSGGETPVPAATTRTAAPTAPSVPSQASSASAAPPCSSASLDQLAEIGGAYQNLPPGRGVYGGETVSISVDGFTTLIAARVNNGTDQPVGVWALGDGTVDAVDKTAQQYTKWGAAAEPGSQTANDRTALVASPEYRAVVSCAIHAS